MRSPETYLVLGLGILLFISVSIGSAPLVSAYSSWIRDPDNPIIGSGNMGELEILFDGTTYHLFYGLGSGDRRVMHATSSTIGGTFTPDGANPVFDPGTGANPGGRAILKDIENGSPIKLSDNDLGIGASTTKKYWLFYQCAEGIGVATNTSLDGAWTKETEHSPCLEPVPGTWEALWFGFDGITVVKDTDGTFTMLYSAQDATGTYLRLGLATSDNLVGWSKSGSNPILTCGPPDSFDDGGIYGHDLWKEGSTYILIYTGSELEGPPHPEKMGIATGTSLTNLIKSVRNPIAWSSGDAWESAWISDFALYRTGSLDYVFYEGEDGTEAIGRMWCANILTADDDLISPSLSVSPENGLAGTDVTFTGTDFTPNAEVNIYYLVDTEWIMKIAATDSGGGFTSTSHEIDNLHGADIQFIALDQTTWIWSNVVRFIVTDEPTPHIEINPTGGSTNVIVTITGTYFTPNCSVSIFNQGWRIELIVADGDGKFTTFFTIPANTPLGQSQFIAYDHVSDVFSNETFYTITSQEGINPILSIYPTAGRDNIPITFTGSGFTLGGLVQIATRDSTGLIVTIGALFTDNTGAFEVDINPWSVLGIAGGGHYLNFHALDVATGVMSNEVIFTRTGVLPSEGPAGSLVDLFLPFTGGDVATAGYLVGTLFFVGPLTIIGLAAVAAAKARQYAGLTVFGFFLLSVFICVMTSLYPWWFLVTIIAIIALVFARDWFGRG